MPQKRNPFTEYLKHLRRLGRPPTGVANARSYIKRYQQWLSESGIADPLHVSRPDLESFLSWLRESLAPRKGSKPAASTIFHYQGFLRVFYRFLKDEGQILSNPMDGIRSTKVPKRIRQDVLTMDELRRLLAQPDPDTPHGLRDLAALHIMTFSGLRVGALCSLRVDEVRLKEREIIVRQGKGQKDRLTFFDVETQQVLARYLLQSRPVLAEDGALTLLADDKGKKMRGWQVKDMVLRYSKRARIRKHITPHSLRRTFCTMLLVAGCNLKVVSELAGHNSLDTTAGYTRLDITELTRVYQQTHPRGQL